MRAGLRAFEFTSFLRGNVDDKFYAADLCVRAEATAFMATKRERLYATYELDGPYGVNPQPLRTL